MTINLNGNVRTFTPFIPAPPTFRDEIFRPKMGGLYSKTNYLEKAVNSSSKDTSKEPTYKTKTSNLAPIFLKGHSETDINEMNSIHERNLRINANCTPKTGELYSNYLEKAVNSSPNSANDFLKQATEVKSQSPNKYEKTGKSWVLEGESPKTDKKIGIFNPASPTSRTEMFKPKTGELYSNYLEKAVNSSAKDVSNEGKNIYKGDLNKSIQLTLAPKTGEIYSRTNYSKLHTPTSPNPALNSAKNIDYQEQSINKSLNQSPNKYEKTDKSWILEVESPKTSAKDVSKQATEVKSQSPIYSSKHTEIYATFAGRNPKSPDSLSPEMLKFANNFRTFRSI
jgi:hypothetical protein